ENRPDIAGLVRLIEGKAHDARHCGALLIGAIPAVLLERLLPAARRRPGALCPWDLRPRAKWLLANRRVRGYQAPRAAGGLRAGVPHGGVLLVRFKTAEGLYGDG
ncbi:MAG: hypothetical protein ACXW2T_00200, partial [Allosphingosinicella sp.]